MRTILFLILVGMIAIQPAAAFVPIELRDRITNDAALYTVSMQHQGEIWAQGNVEYLVHTHTNRIRVNELSLKELGIKMKYLIEEERKKNDPYRCDDCFEVTP